MRDNGKSIFTAQRDLIRYSGGGSADGELAASALFGGSGMTPVPATQVKARVQGQAGARRIGGQLGPVADRVMDYASAGTGGGIVHAEDISYPPMVGSPSAPADADGDGLSDAYEGKYGAAAPMDLIADGSAWQGYMHIERANWELVDGD